MYPNNLLRLVAAAGLLLALAACGGGDADEPDTSRPDDARRRALEAPAQPAGQR